MAVLVFYLYGKEEFMTKKEAVKIIRKKNMPKSLENRFIENGLSDLLEEVYIRSAELFEENRSANRALQTHLDQILPCIAFYEALLKKTGSKEAALKLYDEWAFDSLLKLAVAFRKIMNTGLYKKIPAIADKLIDKAFGSEAGFVSKSVADSKPFARDMLVCPYYETCKKYGCPEITQFFCKSDDITYGNLHPKLVWKRTQTLGMGGECCDFRLYLKD